MYVWAEIYNSLSKREYIGGHEIPVLINIIHGPNVITDQITINKITKTNNSSTNEVCQFSKNNSASIKLPISPLKSLLYVSVVYVTI